MKTHPEQHRQALFSAHTASRKARRMTGQRETEMEPEQLRVWLKGPAGLACSFLLHQIVCSFAHLLTPTFVFLPHGFLSLPDFGPTSSH